MVPTDIAEVLTDDQQAWCRVRRELQARRHELGVEAASLYPDVLRVAGTALLTDHCWVPDAPLPLTELGLRWNPAGPPVAVRGTEPWSEPLRPHDRAGKRCRSYSDAVAALAAPAVFENRSTYRLDDATLTSAAGPPAMTFSRGSYFDAIDVGECCAHELAAHRLDPTAGMPLREAVGNPCDPRRRPMNLAISALTLRVDRARGEAGFPLHWRDPKKVGHAGGMSMVIPVGIFQACAAGSAHEQNDFTLWRCLVREFAEELLGQPEPSSAQPIDYDAWPFAHRLTAALSQGQVRAHVLGLGVDPLTLATDLLTVVAIDAELFDEVFADLAPMNDEGSLVRPGAGGTLFGFDGSTVDHLTSAEPMQAAGAALLRLAWSHRATIL